MYQLMFIQEERRKTEEQRHRAEEAEQRAEAAKQEAEEATKKLEDSIRLLVESCKNEGLAQEDTIKKLMIVYDTEKAWEKLKQYWK